MRGIWAASYPMSGGTSFAITTMIVRAVRFKVGVASTGEAFESRGSEYDCGGGRGFWLFLNGLEWFPVTSASVTAVQTLAPGYVVIDVGESAFGTSSLLLSMFL